jgi:hypothetical protein
MQCWKLFQAKRCIENKLEAVNYHGVISFWKFSRRIKQIEAQRTMLEVADNFNDEYACKKCIRMWYTRMKRDQSMRHKLEVSEVFHRQKNQSFALMILSSMAQ